MDYIYRFDAFLQFMLRYFHKYSIGYHHSVYNCDCLLWNLKCVNTCEREVELFPIVCAIIFLGTHFPLFQIKKAFDVFDMWQEYPNPDQNQGLSKAFSI